MHPSFFEQYGMSFITEQKCSVIQVLIYVFPREINFNKKRKIKNPLTD